MYGTYVSSSKLAVEKLIRPHLNYKEEAETHRPIRSIAKIAFTHGATIDAVTRLARNGCFSGGSKDEHLAGEFYGVPNPDFNGWEKTNAGKRIAQRILATEINPVAIAIRYAETVEVGHYANAEQLSHGVVIAFSAEAVHHQAEINEDLSLEELEIAIPQAPELHTIEGIYPVNFMAAQVLSEQLKGVY